MSTTLEHIVAAHAGKPHELLVLADKLVDCYGAIPIAALDLMQQQLGLTAIEIQSVLSFYHYPVADQPVKCHVEVCTALSCHMKSAERLLKHVCDAFHVNPDQVSEDGRLLISRVECLSDCEKAPAVHVNGKSVSAADMDFMVQQINEVLE